MQRKQDPDVIELDVNQLEANLDAIEQTLGEAMARPFRQLVGWYLSLLALIEQKNTTIARLRRLLFGARTERSDNLQPSEDVDSDSPRDTADSADSSTTDSASAPPTDDG